MNQISTLTTILVLCLSVAGGAVPAQAQSNRYVVVVHPDNPSTSLSKKKLSNLLLKKSLRWDHGAMALPVDLDSKSSVRESLTKDVHKRSVIQIKNYWHSEIFKGGKNPPPEVSSDSEVIEFVNANAGAIGYVSSRARLNGVKSLNIVQ